MQSGIPHYCNGKFPSFAIQILSLEIPHRQLRIFVCKSGDFYLAKNTQEAHGCKWISEYEEGIAGEELLFDRNLIIEALEAVIVNACESYGSTVEGKNDIFKIHHSNDPGLQYVISIIDHEAGISSDSFPNIFDHFYSIKTKQMGMGLTLALRIVEEQRGALSVTSKIGEDSRVSFHLVKEKRCPLRTTKL